MDNFSKLLSKRRSIRKFTTESINPDSVELILKAALKSPSSKNAKPCYFIAVENKDTLEKLSYCKKSGSKLIAECSLAIIVAADPLVSDVWIEDASIASILMQLQAEDLDIGSCWIQLRGRFTAQEASSEEYIKDILNLPMQLQVLSLIAFGHKEQEKPLIDDASLDWSKVHIEKF